MIRNPLFAIDGYKLSHRAQYPEGTTRVYSNFTPRSNKHFRTPFFTGEGGSPLVWFGMQAFIKEWLIDNFNQFFFKQPKETVCGQMKQFTKNYLGVELPVDCFEDLHDLGYLPLRVRSIPEGCSVRMGTPVLTMINTDDRFAWLVNYLETLLSAELWPTATAATIAFNYRCIAELWAEKTCDNTEHIQWQCHDFSARGCMGMGGNELVGMGHLTSFMGSDSVYAYSRISEQYNIAQDVAGGVAATEHSVMCMGEKVGELETFRRLVQDIYPEGIVSIVSDTWDLWKVVDEYLPALKDIIMHRKGKVVIRPDSGDPVDILCGRPILNCDKLPHMGAVQSYAAQKTAELGSSIVVEYNGEYFEWVDSNACLRKVSNTVVKGLIERLWEIFGGSINNRGYKVLDSHIGAIYGDSITLDRANQIFSRLERKGFASSNVVLGIGSFTYQYVTRDTFGFAMKATWGIVKGEPREIFKDPATDNGTKKSLKGLITHKFVGDGQWVARDGADIDEEAKTDLPVVFENGKLTVEDTLDIVRWRVEGLVEQAVKAKILAQSQHRKAP